MESVPSMEVPIRAACTKYCCRAHLSLRDISHRDMMEETGLGSGRCNHHAMARVGLLLGGWHGPHIRGEMAER